MNKVAKPLKIFISYGHEIGVKDEFGNLYPEPNNESVVLQIKKYLESRGHEIWIDKERIKPGDDWRKAIYNGVEWSDVALICLSRKAMRPDGVCRDEIAIALEVRGGNMFPVKLEELENSEYPSYLLTHQLFTKLMDWRSHWSADHFDKDWFDMNLEALANALEEEKVRLYGDQIVQLKNILNPWNMNARLQRLDRGIQYIFDEKTQEYEKVFVQNFCGRHSLFKLFEDKTQRSQAIRLPSNRVLWLKKGPGFGKSRFVAELLYRYRYAIIAAFFIEYSQPETIKAQRFITSIAFQLAQANSVYREKLLKYLNEESDNINLQTDDPQTLFKTLLVDLLVDDIDGGKATQWILVDALDEATDNNRNEIASLISQNLDNLPPWISFFITSRENDDVVNQNFAQVTPIDFTDEENFNDVREYIRSEFREMNLPVSEELVNILQEKSEGTFLYPEMVFRNLEKKEFTIDNIRNLPNGVIKYIHSQFNRLFSDKLELYKKEIRSLLGYILTSSEPAPRAVLKYCLGIHRDSELDDRLKLLGTFFVQSGLTDEDTVAPFHKSVIDYCFDRNNSGNYYVYPEEAKEDFAKCGLKLYESGDLQWTKRNEEIPNVAQRYFLTWLPTLLINAHKKSSAVEVMADFAFLMKRLRFGNLNRILLDFILFRDDLNGLSSDCDAYFNVICSSAHFLRRNCDNNPAYKIMLQIATEVADECPVTHAAQRWLNPEQGDSPCNWFWLNKVRRPKEYQPNPCKLVMENAGSHALLLSNGMALSWGTDDFNLRIWDLETGICKAVLQGHKNSIFDVIELRSGDILSWSKDKTLRLWSPKGACKAVFQGHSSIVVNAIELRSGDILSYSRDKTFRLWSPDGTCKAILKGRFGYLSNYKELRSGTILSWSKDLYLRLWSLDGKQAKYLEGHTDEVNGALELRTGDVLSWSKDGSLRLWSSTGRCKAVLKGHKSEVIDAIELQSGDILSWGKDGSLCLWSSTGRCKTSLKKPVSSIIKAVELCSGYILSWSKDKTLRLWTSEGACKTTMEGHTRSIRGALELHSGDILSWSDDKIIYVWTSEGACKAILEGHIKGVNGAVELGSGDILTWSDDKMLRLWSLEDSSKMIQKSLMYIIAGALELRSGDILTWSEDNVLRLWSPDGSCKTALEGHIKGVNGAIELYSGDILTWHDDATMRLWSIDGSCKAVLQGHANVVYNAIELRSGDILSWSKDKTLRLWSSSGECKSVLKGHIDKIIGAVELNSGDILSWGEDCTMRIWSPEGYCKNILKETNGSVIGAIELHSGGILSWSTGNTLRLWSSEGACKATLEGCSVGIKDAIELNTGDILSQSNDYVLRLWSSDGVCKEVIPPKSPKYYSLVLLFYKNRNTDLFYAKRSNWGIELQHDFVSIVQWNSLYHNSLFVRPARICVWYGRNIEFLQLNYGNRMSVTFEQAHQFLNGEIDESGLTTYYLEKQDDPKWERKPTDSIEVEGKNGSANPSEPSSKPKRGFLSWLFGRK